MRSSRSEARHAGRPATVSATIAKRWKLEACGRGTVRRRLRRDDEETIEGQRRFGRRPDVDVPAMDGVERATENADAAMVHCLFTLLRRRRDAGAGAESTSLSLSGSVDPPSAAR